MIRAAEVPLSLRSYLADVWQVERGASISATILLLLLTLSEGAGLAMLVPMLSLLLADNELGGLVAMIGEAIGRIGLALTLENLLTVFAGILAVRAGLQYVYARTVAGIITRYAAHWRERLFATALAVPWPVMSRQNTTRAVQLITTEVAHIASGTDAVFRLAAVLGGTVITVIVCALVDPILTFMALAAGGLLYFVINPFARRVLAMGHASLETHGALYRTITQRMSGIRTAKAMGTAKADGTRFSRETRKLARIEFDIQEASIRTRLFHNLGGIVLLVVAVLVAGHYFNASIAELGIIAILFVRLVPRASEIQTTLQRLNVIQPAFSALKDWVGLPREDAGDETSKAVAPEEWKSPVRIDLIDVSYQHSVDSGGDAGARNRGIAKVSHVFQPGSVSALVGPSGAGKTTLVEIIAGVLHAPSGELKVSGLKLDEALFSTWRQTIGYVLQDGFLLNDTVRANLQWGGPVVNDDEIWRVLAVAGAADLVRSMPEGLDSEIGERGALVSGGERQRLCLARALLRKPPLLILDEAMNALSPADEDVLAERLRKLKPRPTVIVVAHRPSSAAWADEVLTIENGRIVAVTANKNVDGIEA